MRHSETDSYREMDANEHQISLMLLGDVADYLKRLPTHPKTYEILQRINSHLHHPNAKAMQQRVAILAADQTMSARLASSNGFNGVYRYITNGEPVIAARLIYPFLRLESPAIQSYLNKGDQNRAEHLSAAIGREIAEGVSIDLSPISDLT